MTKKQLLNKQREAAIKTNSKLTAEARSIAAKKGWKKIKKEKRLLNSIERLIQKDSELNK